MKLWCLVLIFIAPCVFGTINNSDSRNQRQELMKKYMKRLQKDEGEHNFTDTFYNEIIMCLFVLRFNKVGGWT